MLDLIPREILLAIIDRLPHNRDRSSISQVSKKLYTLVLPILYESITIRSKDELDLAQTDIYKLLRSTNQHYFTYTRNISFLAPIERKDQFRCLHYEILSDFEGFREVDEEDTDTTDAALVSRVDNLGGLMPSVMPLFQGLQDDHLRSFHWHLGICVPKDIFGPGGYLPTKQQNIEELSLNTGDPCILPKKDWVYQINLTGFNSLRNFSWRGGLSREYFDALRDMLRTYSISLEVLNIDLMDWWDAQWNWCANDYDLQLWIKDHNFFGERVLGLAPGSTLVLFPSLKSLSLSSVHFRGASLEIARSFNISRLDHLNLRDCPLTGSLLRKVVESGQPINLRSLELVIRHNSDDSYRKDVDEDWIESFLNSFEGLTNLNLLVMNGEGVEILHRYWPSIFHHKKTLTRLVYHERRYDFCLMDCNRKLENDKVLKLFTQMNLECIGLCLSPTIPTNKNFSHLTLAQLHALKFLCLRTTGLDSELEHPYEFSIDGKSTNHGFATWAFSAFPNLLFIAFGDFSYGRRTTGNSEILRRHPFPGVSSNDDPPTIEAIESRNKNISDRFRQLQKNDFRYEGYLGQFQDVLEACPAVPLYRKDF
ncbi:hypothetical protein N431DRAFT_388295 [Stipitochalara longipes BDJ]|nr:hypothetical protein N431DRAFT_388295 [Stipitochalara longipes BDJ]